MAKNRNSNKSSRQKTSDQEVADGAQAMDTSEVTVSRPSGGIFHSKVKVVQMKKRSNNVRKMKAIAGVQAMDTSEITVSRPSGGTLHSKVKVVQMKRSKNVRKKKALAKAISKQEKNVEKVLKSESRTSRIQSAKNLYD